MEALRYSGKSISIIRLELASSSNIALMINALSGLASAFTILFLFWTITHLAKRFVVKTDLPNTAHFIAIFGSGIVGALAYTFSDTFWFSAVEGELYSMPAKNPRINVVLEHPLYKQVQFLSRKDGVSMSAKVRELLKEIIETQEDIFLSEIASERETRWKDSEAIPHPEVWS